MNQVIIRPARAGEVKTLQNLNDEVFIDNYKYDPDLRLDWAQSEEGGKKYFTELLSDPNSMCIIAEVDGKPVGYLAASQKIISYRKSKCIELDNMGVIPAFRSMGIGTKLIQHLYSMAREQGYQRVYVNAYFHNTKAIEFYKRNGFSEIDLSLEKVL